MPCQRTVDIAEQDKWHKAIHIAMLTVLRDGIGGWRSENRYWRLPGQVCPA